ncbi:hypothetical protein R3X28_19035 [Maribacter sp. TH_r10]|uniref:hypothetical protein n=1 Tax=Maribacter sp. TH_r10 TaxID=3082086 RepID=UPI002954404A|nr:hypothetical protein [Maribacter sp. TH_r10]MDV7140990.1 hypothetical protein [Maribacter sp. TH_r10]
MQGKKDYQEKLFASYQLAIAYNLKKYLKFIEKRTKSGAGMLALLFFIKNKCQELERTLVAPLKI